MLKLRNHAPPPSAVFIFMMQADGFFVYRADTRRFQAAEALRVKNAVQDWIFENTRDDAACGSGFEGRHYPRLKDPAGSTVFVVFASVDDAEAFEDAHDVRGFTPTLVR